MNITFVRVPFQSLFGINLPLYPIAYGSLSAILKKYCPDIKIALVDGETKRTALLEENRIRGFLSHFETLSMRVKKGIHVFESFSQDRSAPIWEFLVQEIADTKPDLIGFQCYTMFMSSIDILCEKIKRVMPDVRIVLGGPHATLLPVKTLDEIPGADICVVGDGWHTLLELVQALYESRFDFSRIDGIAYRQNGSIKMTSPRNLLLDLDEIPFVDRLLGQPKDYYWEQWVYTSIGCPWHCRMCAANKLGRGKVRFRSVDNVIDELRLLNRAGFSFIRLCDDTFTASRKRVLEFCKKLEESRMDDFHFFIQSRVDQVDHEMVRALKKAGAREFLFGVESGSSNTLQMMNKEIARDQIIRAFGLVKPFKLMTHASFMIGNPAESAKDVQVSMQLYDLIKPTRAIVCVATPFAGTPFWDDAKERGFSYDITNYFRLHAHPTSENNLSNMNDLELADNYQLFSNRIARRERLFQLRKGFELLAKNPRRFYRATYRSLFYPLHKSIRKAGAR